MDVVDRTAAESLVKAILWVEALRRIAMSPTPGTTTSWSAWSRCATASRSGRIARVDHLPAQDLLVVKSGDREVLVPFVAAIVPTVDIAAGTVTLTPPAGLFEDLPDPDPEPESAAEPASDADA